MLTETVAVTSLIKSAIDVAKAARDEVKGRDAKEQLDSLLSALLDIRMATLDLIEENHQFKVAHDKRAEFELERKRYVLHEFAPGVLVYRFKGDPANSDDSVTPEHYLCASCFEKGDKSYLQRTAKDLSGTKYHCHSCNSEIVDHTDRASAACITVSQPKNKRIWDAF